MEHGNKSSHEIVWQLYEMVLGFHSPVHEIVYQMLESHFEKRFDLNVMSPAFPSKGSFPNSDQYVNVPPLCW